MKAVVCTKYGPPEVLQIREIPKPIPKDNEVCIKNYVTAVTGSDVLIRAANMPFFMKMMFQLMLGFGKPRNPVIGLIFAGEIESVGKDVSEYKTGDQVYGFTGYGFSAYAEYLCISEEVSKRGCLSKKPSGMTFEEAAAIAYGGVLAPFFVEKGNIQTGGKVLVYGASGALGSTSVQLLINLGATVTGVCSTKNIEFVKSLGAEKVIDYTKEDISDCREQFDFVLDAVPNGKIDRKKLKSQCKKLLTPIGVYTSIDAGSPVLKKENLTKINTLFSEGKYKVKIDRTFALEQIVEAHRYVDRGHKQGNVIVTIK